MMQRVRWVTNTHTVTAELKALAFPSEQAECERLSDPAVTLVCVCVHVRLHVSPLQGLSAS